ncbi:MAG: hypothetical protein HQ592_16715 [Planctomycetes bacterium]|nr:hypothetical protein [Planctomycetota bacterium]
MSKAVTLITLPVIIWLATFQNNVSAESTPQAEAARVPEFEKRVNTIDEKLSHLGLELEALKVKTASDTGFEKRLNALDKKLSGLGWELKGLNQKTANDKVSLQLDDRQLGQEVSHLRWILTSLGIAGLGGLIAAVVSAVKWAKRKMQEELEKAIYSVDPTHWTVHVPADNFGSEIRRLEWLGFSKMVTYGKLDDGCLSDLVVVRIAKAEDVDKFRDFLRAKNPDRREVGYVLYTTIRIPPEIVDEFENVTFANSSATLGNALLVLARGLRR